MRAGRAVPEQLARHPEMHVQVTAIQGDQDMFTAALY